MLLRVLSVVLEGQVLGGEVVAHLRVLPVCLLLRNLLRDLLRDLLRNLPVRLVRRQLRVVWKLRERAVLRQRRAVVRELLL